MVSMSYGSHEGLIGLGKILDDLDSFTGMAAEQCAKDLLETLRRNTPIDTGRARASWTASVDTYTMGGMTDAPPFVGGVEIEMRHSTKGAKFLSAPRKAGNEIENLGFDPKKNTSIVISSNIPYMARLNRGWSTTQQPTPGWIERCIDEVTSRWGAI